ncbi:hypothetical protein FNV43_RR01338 [Rhamnella rubrinervis]|uniref:Uncharacterized protein n=1 Tax=Rhamnella rubrinervis TaxID=2594499 RepID=A0A8K0HQS2_9ROSA|nr:hypothetical protein FNV43_RR01338 [Rhamnella rubrinervis]
MLAATTANSAVNFIQAVLQLVEKADDDDGYDVPQLIKFQNDDGLYLPLIGSARVLEQLHQSVAKPTHLLSSV